MVASPMNSLALRQKVESWTWPISLAEFRRQYWFRQLFFNHRGASAVGDYRGVLPHDAEGVRDGEWLRLLGGSPRVPIRREGRTIRIESTSHEEAIRSYRAGQSIYIQNPECMVPSVEDLARAFEVPRDSVTCTLHASQRGGGTPIHFDAAETFAIQLEGTKVWSVAENRSVRFPLNNWEFGAPLIPAIRDYVPDELRRSEVLAESRSVIATAGTVLYLPRGYWHATETVQDSVSVHFHYRTISWLDLIQNALRRELCRYPEWRKAAFGFGEDAEERERAVTELAPILAKLASDIAGLGVSDLIGPTGSGSEPMAFDDSVRYRRIALCSGGIESVNSNGAKVMRFTLLSPLHEVVSEFEVPAGLVEACLWICSKSGSCRFGVADVVQLGLSRAEACEVLEVLMAAGLVERASDQY